MKQNITVILHHYTSLMHRKSVSQKMTNRSQYHIMSPSHWSSYAFLLVLLLFAQALKCYFILFT